MKVETMRSFATACAALLAATPSLAQAAEAPCLTPAEASSLAAYALPSVISGTTKRCSAALGPDAFLRNGGGELASRYAARKSQNWPLAKTGFFKIGGDSQDQSAAFLSGLPDASLQQMLDAIIEGMVAQEIPTKDCKTIDRIIGLLAPLPAQNTAELITVVIGLAGASGKAKGDKFSICKS